MDVFYNEKVRKAQVYFFWTSIFLIAIFTIFYFSLPEKYEILFLIPTIFSVCHFFIYQNKLIKYFNKIEQLKINLEESQIIAKIGNWNFDLLTNDLVWSSEHYRIFEIPEPQDEEKLFLLYREKIHPEDVLQLDKIINHSKITGKGFTFVHRLLFDDGRIKYVQGIGKVNLDNKGRTISISGTCQDQTIETTEKLVLEEQTLKFQELFKGINESAIVTITDELGNINYVNDKFVEISGYSRHELIGANHRIVNSGIHPKEFFSEMWTTISKGKAWRGEICNRRKDGTNYWVSTVISHSKNNLGITQYMSIRFDITEQKYIENKFQENEQRWKFALDGAGDGLWDWNISNNEVFYSARWLELLGFEAHEVGSNFDEMEKRIHPSDKEKVFSNLKKHLNKGDTYYNEHRVLCKDGTYKWILDRGMVMSRDNLGVPLRMVGTFTDLTNIKQAQSQAVQASKLASLGEMSAGMAHEINNPLTIIAGSLKLITRYVDNPAKFATTIQSIQKSTDRISKIVKGLKKFSRISDENSYLNCSLDFIAREAITLTESKAKHDSTIVTYDIEENLIIYCDEVGIEQVLINLINNAIDAVKKSENPWVRVQGFSDQGSVVLRVFDSGPGIPEKIKNKLFDPFFTTKTVGEGTGLGLSISKGILDQHKATISVLPYEINTCFEIRFPKIEVIYVD